MVLHQEVFQVAVLEQDVASILVAVDMVVPEQELELGRVAQELAAQRFLVSS